MTRTIEALQLDMYLKDSNLTNAVSAERERVVPRERVTWKTSSMVNEEDNTDFL